MPAWDISAIPQLPMSTSQSSSSPERSCILDRITSLKIFKSLAATAGMIHDIRDYAKRSTFDAILGELIRAVDGL